MNFEHGLSDLDNIIKQSGLTTESDAYLDFVGWQRQLRDSIANERRYAGLSQEEHERRERILRELDRLALRHADRTFVELCGERAVVSSENTPVRPVGPQISPSREHKASFGPNEKAIREGPKCTHANKTGKGLEHWVADAYRQMRARKVEHDVELGGNQIDVYVELETPGCLLHRIAVEAKDWGSKVGVDIVNGFAAIVNLHRGNRLIDEGVIVSATGFSRQARNAAREHGIQLLERADLEAMVAEARTTTPTANPAPVIPAESSTPQPLPKSTAGKRRSAAEASTPSKHRYDAFISYSRRNKKWVHGWLLTRLEEAGVRVCIDFRDFEPGAPSLTEMERAVAESRKTLLVLTPDYLASEWAEFESILASTLDPAARQRRVIPLLLKSCELPLRIRALTYLDFTGPDTESQLQRLVAAIQAEQEVGQPPVVSQPVSSQVPDLGLLATDPANGQPASHLEFSIPPSDQGKELAWRIAFRLCLENQGPVLARYVSVEMHVVSDTDSFWMYSYGDGSPFLIEESPRTWQIALSDARIRCYFEGGTNFVCHSKTRQGLGLVKMFVPYGQPDTTLTFSYRILAEGCERQGVFSVALKPKC